MSYVSSTLFTLLKSINPCISFESQRVAKETSQDLLSRTCSSCLSWVETNEAEKENEKKKFDGDEGNSQYVCMRVCTRVCMCVYVNQVSFQKLHSTRYTAVLSQRELASIEVRPRSFLVSCNRILLSSCLLIPNTCSISSSPYARKNSRGSKVLLLLLAGYLHSSWKRASYHIFNGRVSRNALEDSTYFSLFFLIYFCIRFTWLGFNWSIDFGSKLLCLVWILCVKSENLSRGTMRQLDTSENGQRTVHLLGAVTSPAWPLTPLMLERPLGNPLWDGYPWSTTKYLQKLHISLSRRSFDTFIQKL